MLKLSSSFDSKKFIWAEWVINSYIFGAGAASCYGFGSDQKMQLLAAPAPQHWFAGMYIYDVAVEGVKLDMAFGWNGSETFLRPGNPEDMAQAKNSDTCDSVQVTAQIL
jgi:hypothetical protein